MKASKRRAQSEAGGGGVVPGAVGAQHRGQAGQLCGLVQWAVDCAVLELRDGLLRDTNLRAK